MLEALYEIAPRANILVILLETANLASAECELPANASIVNLGRDWAHLTIDERWLIVLKLIQSTAPAARIHVRESLFCGGFLDANRALLNNNPLILYPLARTAAGRLPDRPPHGFSTCFVDANIMVRLMRRSTTPR